MKYWIPFMPEYWKQKVIFINVKSPGGYDFFIFFFLINFQDPVVWIKKVILFLVIYFIKVTVPNIYVTLNHGEFHHGDWSKTSIPHLGLDSVALIQRKTMPQIKKENNRCLNTLKNVPRKWSKNFRCPLYKLILL